jgi:hypothetical protein
MEKATSSHSESAASHNRHLEELEPIRSTGSNILPEVTEAYEADNLSDSTHEPELGPVDVEKDEKVNPFSPQAYPDGGREAWLCVFGAWCCLFVSFGWINCTAAFLLNRH